MPPPAAGTAVGGDVDLTGILETLHRDLDIEMAPTRAIDAPLTDPRSLERPTGPEKIIVESTGGIDFRPAVASYPKRLLGLFIDSVFLTISVIPGIFLLIAFEETNIRLLGVFTIVAAFFAMNLWYAVSVAATGQWLGNRAARTRVVDSRTGADLDIARAGARFIVRHLVSVVLLIGFITAHRDNQGQAFHDKIAGSVVVGRARENWSAGRTGISAARPGSLTAVERPDVSSPPRTRE